MNRFEELTNEELEVVDGGHPAWVIIGAVWVAVQGVNACYDAGKNLGEYIYHVTH